MVTVLKIEARKVRKLYDSSTGHKTLALDSIDLKVNEKEFVSIVGRTGCGKTTFLEIVAGLTAPTSGEVLVDGKVVVGSDFNKGFVFQHYALFPWRTVKENVCFGLETQKVPGDKREAICKKYLSLVGLFGFKDHYIHELSGGMKQRVAIARALAYNPSILLLDEPFCSLDEQTGKIMRDELLRIQQIEQKTILFVTHNIAEAVYLSDKIVLMSARPGKIKKILDVDLQKSRKKKDFAFSKAFLKIQRKAWKILKEEVFQPENVENKLIDTGEGNIE